MPAQRQAARCLRSGPAAPWARDAILQRSVVSSTELGTAVTPVAGKPMISALDLHEGTALDLDETPRGSSCPGDPTAGLDDRFAQCHCFPPPLGSTIIVVVHTIFRRPTSGIEVADPAVGARLLILVGAPRARQQTVSDGLFFPRQTECRHLFGRFFASAPYAIIFL